MTGTLSSGRPTRIAPRPGLERGSARTDWRRAPSARHPSMRGRGAVLRPIVPHAVLRSEAIRRRSVRRQLAGVASNEFRPDVEGLRAVAVVAVVLFHLRIGAFSGGFVGVDVFFVLSGFLITRLLVRELATTGSISLPSFWARRARRLLPASAFVLVVTVVASRWMLAPLSLRTVATDALASGGFVVNFVFANRLGDYFGAQLADAQPSPLLHFWSLAVEEQFYLVWPLVLVAAARRPRQYRHLLGVIVAGGVTTSVLASIWLTEHRPTWAFYLLPARMGELLAGAAVAFVGAGFGAVPARVRAGFGWFGIVGILVAVTRYDGSTVFPGTAAWLPVLATVLVITAGGDGGPADGPVRVLGHPVALWLGRHSYAIYLWHWPTLVLIEARYGPLALPWRMAVVGGSVGLAALSLHVIENPVRHARWLALRPGRGLALGAGLCALAMTAGLVIRGSIPPLDSGQEAAAPVLAVPTPAEAVSPASSAPAGLVQPAVSTVAASTTPAAPTTVATAGAGTLLELPAGDLAGLVAANRAVLDAGLAVTDVPSNLRPSVGSVNGDRAAIYGDDCVAIGVETELTPCRYGDAESSTTVVLYGDSHAAQWFPPLLEMAESRGLELIVLTKGGCPTAAVTIPTATLARTCPIWRDAAIEFIGAEQPDVVIVSAWAGYPNSDEEWAAGFDATMSRLTPLGANLVVLGDNPPADVEPASCLSGNVHTADRCTADRAEVVPVSRLEVERQIAGRHGARFVDTTDWLCAETRCPVIIGDILLYRDATHLTTVAATWFRPLLEASLAGIV